MKTMKLLACALPLCAAALLAGCSEAAVDDHPATTEGGGKCTYTATIENDDSRAIVSEENNFQIMWCPGDAASFFHCGEAANLKSNYMGDSSAPYGQFEIEGLDQVEAKEGVHHVGVYPYAADNSYSDGAAGLTMPAEQLYRQGSYGGLNVYMTASAPADEQYSLSYRSFHGALCIQLLGTAPIGSVRFTAIPVDGTDNGGYGAGGGKLSGRVTIAEPYVSSEPTIAVGEVSEGDRTVTLRCEEGVTLREDCVTQFCIALLPGQYKLHVEIFDIYDRLLTERNTKQLTINRRLIKHMAKLTDIAALPVPEVAPTDLSPEGHIANCYVITPAMGAGSYSFDASTMGNGEAGLQFTYATDLLPNGSAINGGATAELLWQDYYDTAASEGLITSVAYDTATKRITFATGSTYHVGNAVVALRDAAGTILWSWHLWFADPQPVNESSTSNPLNMNLGATANTPDDLTNSAGLVYQWGRKDPIIGVGPKANLEVEKTKLSKSMSESKTKIFTLSRETYDIEGNLIPMSSSPQSIGKAGWSSYTDKSEIPFNYSIQYPMTYLVHLNTKGTYGDSWFYDGHSARALYLWGGDNSGTITKSILDPCPYGYKVPDKNELSFTGKATRGLYGYIYKSSTGGEIYIPTGGFRDGVNYYGGLKLSNSSSAYYLVGACWYATTHSTSSSGCYILVQWHSATYENMNYSHTRTDYGYNKCWALPVRCVKTSLQ